MNNSEKIKKIEEFSKTNPERYKKFIGQNNKCKNNKFNKFEYFEEEYFNLNEIAYIETVGKEKIKDAYYAEKWILLPNLKEALIKKFADFDIDEEKLSEEELKEEKMHRYNSVFLPEICKQLDIETAQYYFAKENEKEYLITPSLLKENEKIINGDIMLRDTIGYEGEKFISSEINAMQKYILNVLHIENKEKIKEVREKFIEQMIIARFFNIEDYFSGDWGIIIDSNNNIRNLPMLDMDNSLGEFCAADINLSDKKTYDFEDVILQYSNEENVKKLLMKLKTIDIESAISKTYENTRVDIPQSVQKSYKKYFATLKSRTEKVYKKVFSNNKEDFERE